MDAGALVTAYKSLKTWSQKNLMKDAKQGFEKHIEERFDEASRAFNGTINEGFTQLNNQISDLVVLIQLAERGQHDQAIETIDWNGRLDSLQNYTAEIQKLIIQSALKGVHTSQEFRNVAWEAAEQIFSENRSESNLSFLYELAASIRGWSVGYGYYRQYGGD